MSYSNSFPTQRPTLNLDFANSGKLDSRISYARSSTGTALSSERHLSSENLIPYSNLSSGFLFGRTTLASTNNSAPDGGSDAVSILETVDTASHEAYTTFSCVSGTQYSFVFYLKANGRTKAVLKPQATSTIAHVTYDLTAATSTVTIGSVDSHSITAIGSTGWYKCAVTVTATATGTGYAQFNFLDGTGADTYTGDVTKGMFAWGASVSSTGETALNETSGQIHREYAPTLKTSAANEPRFEYTSDGESEGLLIEASATNLQRYGSAFASWSATKDVSISSNSAVGPNGNLEADLVVATSTPADHYVYDNGATLVSGTDYTASVYVKDSGQRYVQLVGSSGNFGGSKWATFDLTTGSIDANNVTASAVSVGNGWWRIQATMAATGSTQGNIFVTLANSATAARSNSFTGDDFSGVLLFGYQLETGSSASSLVDTGTGSSQLTRSADACSVALGGMLADGQDVTLYAEGDFGNPDDKASNRIGAILQKDSSNYITLYNGSGRSGTGYVVNGGAGQASFTSSVTTGAFKSAISVKPNSFNYASNGIAATEDTSGTVPNYNSLHLGKWHDGTLGLDGTLKRVVLYGQALSSTELAALTS